jgi:hypothetical protein
MRWWHTKISIQGRRRVEIDSKMIDIKNKWNVMRSKILGPSIPSVNLASTSKSMNLSHWVIFLSSLKINFHNLITIARSKYVLTGSYSTAAACPSLQIIIRNKKNMLSLYLEQCESTKGYRVIKIDFPLWVFTFLFLSPFLLLFYNEMKRKVCIRLFTHASDESEKARERARNLCNGTE